ncbi:MAG: DUF21 domain-containing protein [Alphaproteobacteria bacterium]|nr:DUF21 domain-containing protein [Alphaproteobacteria bacterium]
MDVATLATIGGIAVLLVLSGFFSSSETALTAASRPRMHQMEAKGNQRAGLVNRLREDQDHMIGTILLGNNLVNILASALATSVLISLFGETGVIYATIAMTLLVLIFGEILPKTYAFRNADRLCDLILIAAFLVEEGGFFNGVSVSAACAAYNVREEDRCDLCVKPREKHSFWVLLPGVRVVQVRSLGLRHCPRELHRLEPSPLDASGHPPTA